MKKIREGYKMTELGEVPEEWSIKKLEECTIKITDGSHSSPIPVEVSNYKICTVANMKKYKLDLESSTNISEADYTKLIKNGCAAKLGDVLLSKDGTIGKTLLFSQYDENIVFLSSIAIIRPNKNILLGEYLNQYLQDVKTLERLSNTKTGSAIKRIVLRDIKNTKIIVPSREEQKKIALILSTVDEQIDNVDGLIQKNKELKKGLMQELLTKGIGHTKFKKTEIGEIPEEWEVNSNFINIKSGFGFKLKEYVYDGIPLIRINNVMYGRIIDDDLSYLPEEYIESYKEFVLKKGDILLALNRPITNNRLKIGIVDKEPAILYQRVGKLEFKTKKYLGEFFYQYMQGDKFIKVLENTLVGSDQPYIKTSEFEKLKFPVPSIEEQQKIVSILSEVDKKIEEYENKKQKLEELKKGLMQQLLTGKIRV